MCGRLQIAEQSFAVALLTLAGRVQITVFCVASGISRQTRPCTQNEHLFVCQVTRDDVRGVFLLLGVNAV
jgi:hypothetical protein